MRVRSRLSKRKRTTAQLCCHPPPLTLQHYCWWRGEDITQKHARMGLSPVILCGRTGNKDSMDGKKKKDNKIPLLSSVTTEHRRAWRKQRIWRIQRVPMTMSTRTSKKEEEETTHRHSLPPSRQW